MIHLFLSPRQYVQKEGILKDAGEFCRPFGRRPMILGDALVLSIVQSKLAKPFEKSGLQPSFVRFGEECSKKEIRRLVEIVHRERFDSIIGTGGGKSIDTARIVAGQTQLPFVAVPTSAATCSAASSVAVIYDQGIRQETFIGRMPDLVLVDSAVVAAAPFRLLAAGMGDALAKWYETKPVYDRLREVDAPTQAAMTLSTQIKEGGTSGTGNRLPAGAKKERECHFAFESLDSSKTSRTKKEEKQ